MTDTAPAPDPAWEQRVEALWAGFDAHAPADFLARAEALAAELPDGHPAALFELASACDALDREEEAAVHYRDALAAGLGDERRRRAVIQYASTLRNLGRVEESIGLLTVEREAAADDLDDAVAAFLALALVDAGRAREATGLALGALARHLPEYARSVRRYADAL